VTMPPMESTFQPARLPAAPQYLPPRPPEPCPTSGRRRSDINSVKHRLRNHRVPPLVMASLAAAAGAEQALAAAVGDLPAAAATMGAYFVAAVVAWLKAENQVKKDRAERGLNRKDWRRIERRRRYQQVVTGTGATWLCWTLTGWGTEAWAWPVFVGLGGAFLLVHSLRYGLPTPPPARPVSTEIVDDVAGRLKAALEQYVVHHRGQLAYAGLPHHENIDAGGRVMLELVPGKQHIGMVRQLLPALKTALRCHDVTVDFVDPGPSGDPGLVWVTAITRQEVARREQTWDQPGLREDGECGIGGAIDGQDEDTVTVFEENGFFGLMAFGNTGSGKSQSIKNTLLSLSAGPPDPALNAKYAGIVGVHLDGGNGASDPDLHQWCPIRAAGTREIRYVLQELENLLVSRYEENTAEGWDGFDIYTQNRSAYAVVCDELHNYTPDRECNRIMDRISREGRKVGIALFGATSEVTLRAFANNDNLRAQMMGKNILVFHCSSSNPGNLLPGIKVNPKLITNKPGFYVPNGDGKRTVEYRTYRVPKGDGLDRSPSRQPSYADIQGMPGIQAWFDSDEPARAYLEAKVRARKSGAPPPDEYIRPCLRPKVFGAPDLTNPAIAAIHEAGALIDRAQSAEARLDPIRELAAAMEAGTVQVDDATAAVLRECLANEARQVVEAAEDETRKAMEGKSAILRLISSAPSASPQPPAQPRLKDLGVPPRDAVLLLLGAGVNRSKDLENGSGYSEPTVREALTKLVDVERLVEAKPHKQALWTPAPAGFMAIGQLQITNQQAATHAAAYATELARRIS
jgi:hypothetical protein